MRRATHGRWPRRSGILMGVGILTDTMRHTVEQRRCGRVVSRTPDGVRQEANHDWLAVWDDTTLAFPDTGAAPTVRNLIESPAVEVTVVDPGAGAGFRFAGTSHVLISGPLFDRLRSFYATRGLHTGFEHVVFVAVDRVTPVAGAGAPESDEAACNGGLVRSESTREVNQNP